MQKRQTNFYRQFILPKPKEYTLSNDDLIYLHSRIGTSFISSQRVEFLTGQLLDLLTEFPDVYKITTAEFLERSAKSKKAIKTLGTIFSLLKLNPKLVIEEELNDYLKKRNIFVHTFWRTYMTGTQTGENGNKALAFCYDLEESSKKVESFFKGFIYFLSLRHVKDRDHLDEELKKWDSDFEYFMKSHIERSSKKSEL